MAGSPQLASKKVLKIKDAKNLKVEVKNVLKVSSHGQCCCFFHSSKNKVYDETKIFHVCSFIVFSHGHKVWSVLRARLRSCDVSGFETDRPILVPTLSLFELVTAEVAQLSLNVLFFMWLQVKYCRSLSRKNSWCWQEPLKTRQTFNLSLWLEV